MRIFITIVAILLSAYCMAQNCKDLPTSFNSYGQATSLVKTSKFLLKETANTSNSSWIKSAAYYSCDGKTGFFIYSTNKGYEYIHANVPLSIWQDFKAAVSKGTFYNSKIKDRYLLQLE